MCLLIYKAILFKSDGQSYVYGCFTSLSLSTQGCTSIKEGSSAQSWLALPSKSWSPIFCSWATPELTVGLWVTPSLSAFRVSSPPSILFLPPTPSHSSSHYFLTWEPLVFPNYAHSLSMSTIYLPLPHNLFSWVSAFQNPSLHAKFSVQVMCSMDPLRTTHL